MTGRGNALLDTTSALNAAGNGFSVTYDAQTSSSGGSTPPQRQHGGGHWWWSVNVPSTPIVAVSSSTTAGLTSSASSLSPAAAYASPLAVIVPSSASQQGRTAGGLLLDGGGDTLQPETADMPSEPGDSGDDPAPMPGLEQGSSDQAANDSVRILVNDLCFAGGCWESRGI